MALQKLQCFFTKVMGPYRFFEGSGPKFLCRVNGLFKSVKNCKELRDMFNVNFFFIVVTNLKPQQSYSAYRQDNNKYFESSTAYFRTF